MLASLAVPWAVAFAVSLGATGVARVVARHLRVLDRPDGGLKRHARPIPLLGGCAVALAAWIAMAATTRWDASLAGVLAGGTAMLVVGLVDDVRSLGIPAKLALQAGAAAAVLALATPPPDSWLGSGFGVGPGAWLDGPSPTAGAAGFGIAVLWLVGLSNALNFLDVMDGVAAGCSAVCGFGLALAATFGGDMDRAAMGMAVAGACTGFLLHNWPSARIYLGDAGSLFLGLTLGALASEVGLGNAPACARWAPLLVLMLPVTEMLLVCAVRFARGENPMRGSPDHLAHGVRALGVPERAVAPVLWSAGGMHAAGGLALLVLPALPGCTLVVALVAATVVAGARLARVRR